MNYLVTLLLLLLINIAHCTVLIDDEVFQTASTPFFNTDAGVFEVSPFNITARLIWRSVEDNLDGVNGTIVMIDNYYGIDRFARIYKDAGAVGLVMKMQFLGKGGAFLENPRMPLVFPTLEILEEDYNIILGLLDQGEVIATITDDPLDTALFERFYIESLFMNIFFGIFFGIVIIIVTVIFICNVRYDGVKCSFKFLIGVLLIVINVTRFLFLIYDPLARYRLITWKVQGLFYCVHLVMSIASMIFINMFWFEEVNRYSVIKGLDKVKIPYYIIIVILVSLCLISAVLFQTDIAYIIAGPMLIFLLAVLGMTYWIVCIFQLTAAFLIKKRIGHIEKSFQTKKRIHRYIAKVIFISIFEMLFIPVLYFYLLEDYNDVLTAIAATLYWILCGIESLAVSNLLMTKNPKSSTASKSKKSVQ